MRTPRERSPYGLIQEDLRDEPWKLLIACMMLNLTNIKQVRPVICDFFSKYPTPTKAAKADPDELAGMLKPLGLYNRRAAGIIKFSTAFEGPWSDVYSLPGVGKYAADSYQIFVDESLEVLPTDSKLKKYLEWALSRSTDGTGNQMHQDP